MPHTCGTILSIDENSQWPYLLVQYRGLLVVTHLGVCKPGTDTQIPILEMKSGAQFISADTWVENVAFYAFGREDFEDKPHL